MTQREAILAMLQAGDTVTAETARNLHNIVHLPGTIHALRALGHPIEQVWRSARGLRWSEYRLVVSRAS
jgi:hypothetical protein